MYLEPFFVVVFVDICILLILFVSSVCPCLLAPALVFPQAYKHYTASKAVCMYLRLLMFNTKIERAIYSGYPSNSRWTQNIATCTSTVAANIEYNDQSDNIHAFVFLN